MVFENIKIRNRETNRIWPIHGRQDKDLPTLRAVAETDTSKQF